MGAWAHGRAGGLGPLGFELELSFGFCHLTFSPALPLLPVFSAFSALSVRGLGGFGSMPNAKAQITIQTQTTKLK
jgi:hypothetical protein